MTRITSPALLRTTSLFDVTISQSVQMYKFAQIISDERRLAGKTCIKLGQANRFPGKLKDIFVGCKKQLREKHRIGSSGCVHGEVASPGGGLKSLTVPYALLGPKPTG